jgi:hypothetical protein
MRNSLIHIQILILLFFDIKANFFTKGIRKVLGFTIGTSGMKNATLETKFCTQSSGLSSQMLLDKDDYESKKKIYLKAKIDRIIIGLAPLGFNLAAESNFYSFLKNGFGNRAYLPCYLGGCTFNHHALGFIHTNLGYFLIEYGAYQGKDPQYKNWIFYYEGNSGARFIPMEYWEFHDKITNNGNYSYSDKTIDTYINNKMTLGNLFERISKEMSIKFDDYNVADNNCQDFIAYVIKLLKAVRIDKTESKLHNFAKLRIPPKILEALEDNENYQILTTLGKIPIIGVWTDLFGSLLID